MRKIAVFTGTRAEYGLLYWLLKDIQDDPLLELQLLVSGSHLSPEFGCTYTQIEQDGFTIDEKIEILLSSDTAVGVAKSMGLGILGFTDALSRLQPNALIVLGDRFEALAAAQTAMILRIPVVHLHGGDITEGALDDSIRHAITKLSQIHFAAIDVYADRIIQMGENPERVHTVGSLGLEHLTRMDFLSRDALGISLKFDISHSFFLITYHPVTLFNEDPEETFSALLKSLNRFKEHNVIITYPNADDGGRKLIPLIEKYAEENSERVLAIKSLGQLRYLSALKYATAVIGNSSSGLAEAPSFYLPTINIGDRQKGRLASSSVIHAKSTEKSISKAIKLSLTPEFQQEFIKGNIYECNQTSSKIISILKTFKLNFAKKFYDLPPLNKRSSL
ncbi:MAG: UDP-hydrolyzing UDP-N-acetyl-D-glucosamine 2-epimerase [Flavobacteriales bacterium]|jgi:UDP-hydrolysing UDP-N-acetyl-D-glucosamine 2-epimerase